MVYFRKRLTPEVLGEINEMIVRDAKERQVKEAESKDDDDDSDGQPGTGGNGGTMIVDATCAPSNIRYPQDVSLLNEARENAETLLDVLHDPADGKKPRTYRKSARKDYLKYTRCRKHTAKMTERFRAREGHYPSRILADKIYRNRENLSYCKAHGIHLSGPALGRPKKGETRDKAQDYRDKCERVEVERRFSLAKRKCGMGLVTAKLRETAAHVIAMSVLVLNLRKIQRALLRMLAYLLEILAQNKNWTLVQ